MCDGLGMKQNAEGCKIPCPTWNQSSRNFVAMQGTLVLSNAFAWLSIHVSFRRSPLSLEGVKKPNKCIKRFGLQCLGRDDPNFSIRQIVNAIAVMHHLAIGEFRLLTSVCDAWKWSKMQNLRSGCKITVQFSAIVDRSSWHFLTMSKTTCSFQCSCPTMYRVSFGRYRLIDLLKLRIRQK